MERAMVCRGLILLFGFQDFSSVSWNLVSLKVLKAFT